MTGFRMVFVVAIMVVLMAVPCVADPATTDPMAAITAAPPRFDATSADPILLRYKFYPSQTVEMQVDMAQEITLKIGRESMSVPICMSFMASYVVNSVTAEGDASVVLRFDRMRLDVPGPPAVRFDSDTDADTTDPDLQALVALVDVPMGCRISAVGKLLSMDLDAFEMAISEMQTAGLKQMFDDTMADITRSTFVQLSETPVRCGDTYDAGGFTQAMEGMGEMVSRVRYTVLSVSADGKQVVLEPEVTMEFVQAPGQDVSVRLDSMEMDGWLLFDLEWGNIRCSYVDAKMGLALSQDGQTMLMQQQMVMRNRAWEVGEHPRE